MILALSTSSPKVVVAIYVGHERTGVWREDSARNASGKVLEILSREKLDLANVESILIDVGPGSFSGVKVGVTMAKMWSWSMKIPLYPITSFDLIDRNGDVAIGSKVGEVFLRRADGEVEIVPTTSLDASTVGYWRGQSGMGSMPLFDENLLKDMGLISPVDPAELMPFYVGQPSISQPKQSHIMGELFK